MINYLSAECSDGLIKCFGAFKKPIGHQSRQFRIFFQGYIKNKIWDVSQQPITIGQLLCNNSERVQKYASRFNTKPILMVWSTDPDNTKMLLVLGILSQLIM